MGRVFYLLALILGLVVGSGYLYSKELASTPDNPQGNQGQGANSQGSDTLSSNGQLRNGQTLKSEEGSQSGTPPPDLSNSSFSQHSQCIARLQERALSSGLSAHLVDTLAELKPVQRVIELDRSQPEFTENFSKYMSRRVTSYRVSEGRKLLARHDDLLQGLTKKYGIPPQYLVAFWGLESNYGGYKGRMPILDSLVTLACDQRRSEFFTSELFDALILMEDLNMEPKVMLGGWAGAIGHTQFMPSAYRTYALDGDADGRADLWNSIPDALTSAAHFLEALGWEKELRWGREVRLPDGFDYQQSGLDKRLPLRQWRELGVVLPNGNPVPDQDIEAALLIPAGHRGPKFIVYKNFDVIMRWNRSAVYALSVGHLADRVNGAGHLHQRPPANELELMIVQVRAIQEKLLSLGYDPGEVDGLIGPATQKAVQAFQQSQGRVADGHIDLATVNALGIKLSSP